MLIGCKQRPNYVEFAAPKRLIDELLLENVLLMRSSDEDERDEQFLSEKTGRGLVGSLRIFRALAAFGFIRLSIATEWLAGGVTDCSVSV